MASCSKAPWGLFVLLRVGRVLTASAVSPSPWSRHCPDRDAFRAGRNLPDKEFRYLRTVIVTAAVHRGFGSRLAAVPLTFRHWAGVSPYTSAFAFAETCVFGKQSVGPLLCHPSTGSRFSRSYACLLPSSLTRVLSLASVFSTYPPVSVYGTGMTSSSLIGFSRQGLPATSARRLACAPTYHLPAGLLPCVPASLPGHGTGLLTRCPSATPLGLALGPTNPTRINLASETLGFRRGRFSRPSRYSCRHSRFWLLQGGFHYPFAGSQNAPLPMRQRHIPQPRCRA